jgi:hypothetical protein
MLLEKKGKEKGESKRGGVGELYFLAKGWLTVTCRVQGATVPVSYYNVGLTVLLVLGCK